MDRRTRRELMGRLTADTRQIAAHFGLEVRSLEAERANVKSRYGICYDDGSIKIRLNHAVTGAPLKYSSLVNTLCHELAHLRHFNHGPRFKAFYLQILEWARAQKIYQPRSTPANASPALEQAPRVIGRTAAGGNTDARKPSATPVPVPRQLELFGA
jgi:predicted metal-dependent hydrolase